MRTSNYKIYYVDDIDNGIDVKAISKDFLSEGAAGLLLNFKLL